MSKGSVKCIVCHITNASYEQTFRVKSFLFYIIFLFRVAVRGPNIRLNRELARVEPIFYLHHWAVSSKNGVWGYLWRTKTRLTSRSVQHNFCHIISSEKRTQSQTKDTNSCGERELCKEAHFGIQSFRYWLRVHYIAFKPKVMCAVFSLSPVLSLRLNSELVLFLLLIWRVVAVKYWPFIIQSNLWYARFLDL